MCSLLELDYHKGKEILAEKTSTRNYPLFTSNSYDSEKIYKFLKDYPKDFSIAHKSLKKRTSDEYYQKLYPSIFFWNAISSKIFPVYKFFVPTLLNADWLSSVDWKKYHRDHLLHQPLVTSVIETFLANENSFLMKKTDGVSLLDKIVKSLSSFTAEPFIRDYLVNKKLPNNSKWLCENETSVRLEVIVCIA